MSLNNARFVLLWLSSALSQLDVHAQVHALDYTTPAYIDFEFTDMTVYENEASVVVNIFRTGDFRQYTRIDFATEEITADEGQDYNGVGGTITFQPGEGMKQIVIPLIADDKTEPDETFRLVLSDASPNTLLMRDSITITIKDSAGPISAPKLQIASAGPGKVAISWDGDSTCSLERSADAASGLWESVSCTPTVTGTHCEVIQPAGGILYFYRLRLP